MDFEHALHIFNTLYEEVNGYSLSSRGKEEIGSHDKAFVYGEVSPEAFDLIMKNMPKKPQGVFYDLGSGTGKAVVLAHLLYPFSEAVGIEFLTPLHHEAEHILHRLRLEFGALQQSDKSVTFIRGDFLKLDFSNADVIFMHSTCFPDYIWQQLSPKFELLKPGTSVITVTKTISSEALKLLKSKEYGMAWGRATVHYYERR